VGAGSGGVGAGKAAVGSGEQQPPVTPLEATVLRQVRPGGAASALDAPPRAAPVRMGSLSRRALAALRSPTWALRRQGARVVCELAALDAAVSALSGAQVAELTRALLEVRLRTAAGDPLWAMGAPLWRAWLWGEGHRPALL
jgi:hypothetical protein